MKTCTTVHLRVHFQILILESVQGTLYTNYNNGVSWPSGLAYRTRVLVLAAECGFESRP